MTKIQLFFDAAVAKYFAYHCNPIDGKPSNLTPELRKLVLMQAEPVDTPAQISQLPNKVKYEANIPTAFGKYAHDSRYKLMHIPTHKMELLNDTLKKLIDHEINTLIDVFISQKLEIKEAIEFIITKYDFDDGDGYSYDRIKKMNQRFRNKVF